jgi:predicted transcriptional regulator
LFRQIINNIIMKTTVIQRIKEIIEKRGVTSRGFSSEIDFNYTTLNNYLTGRRKAVSCELIEKILSSFGNISKVIPGG